MPKTIKTKKKFSKPKTKAAKPNVDSVDKSKFPLIKTKVWPATNTPNTAAAAKILEILR